MTITESFQPLKYNNQQTQPFNENEKNTTSNNFVQYPTILLSTMAVLDCFFLLTDDKPYRPALPSLTDALG